jgi:Uma2 family endonuclease
MAETDHHRVVMTDTIETLEDYFAGEPTVYVSGNLLIFLELGNKRNHISPDVFVVRGVEKRPRLNYLLWEEGQAPDVVIEITSSSTRREDQGDKLEKYRDVLKVREVFLFDPLGDYLDPPLQGHRLRGGKYLTIRPRAGRLPSLVLGLHLERRGQNLRLWDPSTHSLLPTRSEAKELAQRRADEEKQRADEQARRAERAEVENEWLRQELKRLRQQGE